MDRVTALPRPATRAPRLGPVLDAWSALAAHGSELYAGSAGVGEEEFEAFGRGFIPRELRALWEVSREGIEVMGLGIAIAAWPPESALDYGVEPGPGGQPSDQVQVFGGDLGDDAWAFWLQRGRQPEPDPPVLVIGDHDAGGIRLAGDIAGFLSFQTALALIHDAGPAASIALDRLGVPGPLRALDPDEDSTLDALWEWADPRTIGYGGHHREPPVDAERFEAMARDMP